MSTKTSALTALMRQMNAPREDGFNPIPPRSHRALMDVRFPEEVRILGWALWRTIDIDREGILGPKKARRTSHAHDERGDLELKDLAEDLAMEPTNARAALRRCIENGTVYLDTKGRICPRGNAPDPVRVRICTNPQENKGEDLYRSYPEELRVYFQSLTKSMRDRRLIEYQQVLAYREQLKADAIALARDAGEKFEKAYLESIGYRKPEDGKPKGGRPKKDRPAPAVQLTIVRVPQFEDGSVQILSVQNQNRDLHKSESGSVQTPVSLLSSSEGLQSTSSEVRAALETYGRTDDDAARQLIEACKAKDAKATDGEIAGTVHDIARKIAKRRDIENRVGYLLKAVPRCFPLSRTASPPVSPPPLSLEAEIEATQELLTAFEEIDHPQTAEVRERLDELRAELNGRAKGAHA